jgi:hypothetical protein
MIHQNVFVLVKLGGVCFGPPLYKMGLNLNPQIPWFIIFPAFDSIFSRNMTKPVCESLKGIQFPQELPQERLFYPTILVGTAVVFTPVSRSR